MIVLRCDWCEEIELVEHCQTCGAELCPMHRWSGRHDELHKARVYVSKQESER